jgi:hypothetical protein
MQLSGWQVAAVLAVACLARLLYWYAVHYTPRW